MAPEIFQIKGFTLYTYWLFFALGIIATTYAIILLSKKNNLKIQFLSEHAFYLTGITILGARIGSILVNFNTYFYELNTKTLLSTLYIWDKGLNGWSGLLAFIIAFYFLTKKYEQNFKSWMDILIPSLLYGIALISIGAFFEGSSYGNVTTLKWGVNFESPSIKYIKPIHPTQIYAFIYSLTIAISLSVINIIEENKEKLAGLIATIGILSFSTFKFLEEFVRGDDVMMIYGIRLPQIIAFLAIIVSGTFLIFRYTLKKK